MLATHVQAFPEPLPTHTDQLLLIIFFSSPAYLKKCLDMHGQKLRRHAVAVSGLLGTCCQKGVTLTCTLVPRRTAEARRDLHHVSHVKLVPVDPVEQGLDSMTSASACPHA